MEKKAYEEKDKLKAAYALNMCTVSVSQIIDYNDEYILEQEYDAILNNLNLEAMPKDEALLNILSKLLNVITFFRIDKEKRKQLEKKYQRRMKNAIWSAIPNISVIVSGSPVSVAMSVLNQVGIGYMNYRKEKAQAIAEKEDAEFELRITAIEQFNALRRELFTTAWRLAAEYEFPDKYRLTEKQISQYDEILMDTNEVRKYERLKSIKDKFKAYPPFLYFLGHSAKLISEDPNLGIPKDLKERYKKEAKQYFNEYFEEYYKKNPITLLRVNKFSASSALEYLDLLKQDNCTDNKKIEDLLRIALDNSENDNDIIQLCAISYLSIGNTSESIQLLKQLINEEYNVEINSRILSRLFVYEYLYGMNSDARLDYDLLTFKVNKEDQNFLFPIPKQIERNLKDQDKQLVKDYSDKQRQYLEYEYRDAITQFVNKYSVIIFKLLPNPTKIDVPDEYYFDTSLAKEERINDVKRILEGDERQEYLRNLKDLGFRFRYLETLNNMLASIFKLYLFRNSSNRDYMVSVLRKSVAERRISLERMQEKLNNNAFGFQDYRLLEDILSFRYVTKDFFNELKNNLVKRINELNSIEDIDKAEFELIQFMEEEKIHFSNRSSPKNKDTKVDFIPISILGKEVMDENKQQIFEQMLSKIKNIRQNIILDDRKSVMYLSGEQEFNQFFMDEKYRNYRLRAKTLAIIEDLSSYFFKDHLIITTDGIDYKDLYPFNEIKLENGAIVFSTWTKYDNEGVNIRQLYQLIKDLAQI